MRNQITKTQFIVSCVINGLNTILYFMSYDFTLNYYCLIYLTVITLDLNSIYLFLSFICDISFFIFKSEKLEAMNGFLRNKVCHVLNPISYLVTILFWGIGAFGGMGDIFANFLFCLFNIYAHLLITIFVIIDLLIADHEKHSFSCWILSIIYGYIIAYAIFCAILTLKFDNPPYPFLQEISIVPLLLYYAAFSVVCLLCYLLHLFIIKMKYKYIVKENNENNVKESISEMNDKMNV